MKRLSRGFRSSIFQFSGALLLAVLMGPIRAAAGQATATGTVNNSSGEPVPNATVLVHSAGVRKGYSVFCPTCYTDCGKRARTDATGKFTLDGLDDELIFNLLVVKDGYAPVWIRRVDPLSGTVPPVAMQVRTPIEDPERILRGKVVDVEGGALPDALVEPEGATFLENGQLVTGFGTFGSGDALAVTNERGEFELAYGVPAKKRRPARP